MLAARRVAEHGEVHRARHDGQQSLHDEVYSPVQIEEVRRRPVVHIAAQHREEQREHRARQHQHIGGERRVYGHNRVEEGETFRHADDQTRARREYHHPVDEIVAVAVHISPACRHREQHQSAQIAQRGGQHARKYDVEYDTYRHGSHAVGQACRDIGDYPRHIAEKRRRHQHRPYCGIPFLRNASVGYFAIVVRHHSQMVESVSTASCRAVSLPRLPVSMSYCTPWR